MIQIKQARKFVEDKTQKVGSKDLIIFTGDFNVNGHSENLAVAEYREQLSKHPEYATIIKSLDQEYS